MTKTCHLLLPALAATILCGCVAPPAGRLGPPEPPPASACPPPATGAETTVLLDYAARVSSLAPAELARETEAARQRHAKTMDDADLLRYALVLSAPGGDARRAQQLLEPLVRDPAGHDRAGRNPELRDLALLVYAGLAERRRLDEARQAEVRRAEEAEAKLEALKEIEKKIIQQDGGGERK